MLTWPSAEPTRLRTEVLVIGGGVAGCLAAIQARDAGADVLVADKARFLERAGSVAGGVDQFMTPLDDGPEWDTPQHLMTFVPMLTDGLTDLDVAERAVHDSRESSSGSPRSGSTSPTPPPGSTSGPGPSGCRGSITSTSTAASSSTGSAGTPSVTEPGSCRAR